ncbi:sensor histidine kinase [Tessaracoccus sp. G1721]
MRSLAVRLALSHVAVVAIGALVTFLLSRALAPALYDRMQQRGPRPGQGQGFRQQIIDSMDLALLIGAVAGVLVAATLGLLVARRFMRPIRQLQEAARQMAAGRYDVEVPEAPELELNNLGADLRTLGESLASTEARRVRLLGDVAHELRTPLTVVGGYVEAMTDGVVPPDPEHLGLIGREVERMSRLADDLGALSRSQEGGTELRLERIDVAGVAREAAERLRPQALDAGISLTVECERVWAMADAQRIGQVVTNLVGNALRAVTRGGGVAVGCRTEGDVVRVTVTDDGVGLAAKDLERVFERFYRVDRTIGDQRGGGSGIGLTIARQIARAHGGDLVAASPGLGRGATFTLTLPISPA